MKETTKKKLLCNIYVIMLLLVFTFFDLKLRIHRTSIELAVVLIAVIYILSIMRYYDIEEERLNAKKTIKYRILKRENMLNESFFIPQVGFPEFKTKGFLFWMKNVNEYDWRGIKKHEKFIDRYTFSRKIQIDDMIRFERIEQARTALQKFKEDDDFFHKEWCKIIYKDDVEVIEE